MESDSSRSVVRHLSLPTISPWSAVASWEEQGPLFLRAEVVDPEWNSLEPRDVLTDCYPAVRFRRATFEGLTPATAYTVRIVGPRMPIGAVQFRTPRIPLGRHLARFAVVADPHLSAQPTFRRGRLLGVSYGLFADVVQTLLREAFDGVVIPGDVADTGDEESYAYARDRLSSLSMARLVLAGNQDAPERMQKFFPDALSSTVMESAGCTLVGFNTSQGCVDRNILPWFESVLSKRRKPPVFLFTHHALVPGSWGVRVGKVAEGAESLLEILRAYPHVWGVFFGHKNAVSATRVGHVVHVSCPQIVHYPCAWSVIEVYEQGFVFWMRQIEDLRLVNLSRCEGNRWLGDEWPEYRLGSIDSRSFTYVP